MVWRCVFFVYSLPILIEKFNDQLKILTTNSTEITLQLEQLKKTNSQLLTTTQAQKADIMRMTRLTAEASDTQESLKVAEMNLSQVKSDLNRTIDAYSKERDRGVKLAAQLDETVRYIRHHFVPSYVVFGLLQVAARDVLSIRLEDLTLDLNDLQEKYNTAIQLNQQHIANLEATEKINIKLRSRVERSTSQYEELAVGRLSIAYCVASM